MTLETSNDTCRNNKQKPSITDHMQTFNQKEAFNFTVACCSKKHLFNVAEVVRLEASSNYTLIHALNKRPLMVAKVLSAYEEELAAMGFVRVHRSHLVNKQYICTVDGSGNILMADRQSIDIPRRKRKEVMSQLKHDQ